MRDLPLLIMAIGIWSYWLIGVVLVLRNRLVARSPAGLRARSFIERHDAAGVIPRQRVEQIMWLVWVPLIVLWNALPGMALRKDDPPWALPAFATDSSAMFAVRWLAAGMGVAALLLTIVCWITMGRSWRVAIVPGEKTALVTSGPFRFVRHPIYALSCLMIVCTAVVLPTWPMMILAITHVAMMNIKARNEERFLRGLHGEAYEQYMRHTGRFLPWA